MKDFKNKTIDTPGVIKRVSQLFRGHKVPTHNPCPTIAISPESGLHRHVATDLRVTNGMPSSAEPDLAVQHVPAGRCAGKRRSTPAFRPLPRPNSHGEMTPKHRGCGPTRPSSIMSWRASAGYKIREADLNDMSHPVRPPSPQSRNLAARWQGFGGAMHSGGLKGPYATARTRVSLNS
jgi:hypothetical protein